jgi:hypothetical protein
MSAHPFAPLPQHDNIDQCLATDIAAGYLSAAFQTVAGPNVDMFEMAVAIG